MLVEWKQLSVELPHCELFHLFSSPEIKHHSLCGETRGDWRIETGLLHSPHEDLKSKTAQGWLEELSIIIHCHG